MNSFTYSQQQFKSLQKSTSKSYSSVENNIVDIKNFYVNYLISVLKSSLIDGINGLYDDIIKTKETKSISIQEIKMFKQALKDISFMEATEKIRMLVQIKDNTKTGEMLGNLVKAVFKSYIVLLTFNSTGKVVNSIKENFHNRIDVPEFIYRCYLEFSVLIFFNTDIFIKYHNNIFNYSEQINEMVYSAIETAIYKMLPMSDIISNYINTSSSSEQDNNNVLVEISKYIISKVNKNTESLVQDLYEDVKRLVNDNSDRSYERSEYLEQYKDEIIDEIKKIKNTDEFNKSSNYKTFNNFNEDYKKTVSISKKDIEDGELLSIDSSRFNKTSDTKKISTVSINQKDSVIKIPNSSVTNSTNNSNNSLDKKTIEKEKKINFGLNSVNNEERKFSTMSLPVPKSSFH